VPPRFIALYFPNLSLEVFERVSASPGPLALATRLVVLQSNAPAQAAGVLPGTRRASALALAPELRLLEPDHAREKAALEQLACCALQFTPQVSFVEGLHGLVLDVAASLKLFGGVETLAQSVQQHIAALGFSVRMVYGPTATGAMWLARSTLATPCLLLPTVARFNAALLSLELALIPQAQPYLKVLHSMGIEQVKALVQLPRAGLARRFGQRLLDDIDRAFGKLPEAFTWFSAPPRFNAKLELMAQVEYSQGLLFGAQRLLLQLSAWLHARHAAVQRIELNAFHDDAPPTLIALEFAQATRDLSRMSLVLREHLERLQLPEAVHTLSLQCDKVETLAAGNNELFLKASTQQDSLLQLVERLQVRLGREQVLRVQLREDHRPEAAQRWLSYEKFKGQRAEHPAPAHLLAHGMPRPLWLYPQPLALQERNNRPWLDGPLQLLAGPERIEGAWWASHEGDTGLVERDYFIALNREHTMYWLFRSHTWYVQGVFG
jgi:protein ImuB